MIKGETRGLDYGSYSLSPGAKYLDRMSCGLKTLNMRRFWDPTYVLIRSWGVRGLARP